MMRAAALALLSAATAHAGPAAWHVTNPEGAELWLLGSVHYLRERDYPLPALVDELYGRAFVRPSIALAAAVYKWIDRWLIDGVLHAIARGMWRLAGSFRAFDRLVINGGVDWFVDQLKVFGRWFRQTQTGWVQQYLYVVVIGVLVLAALYLALSL